MIFIKELCRIKTSPISDKEAADYLQAYKEMLAPQTISSYIRTGPLEEEEVQFYKIWGEKIKYWGNLDHIRNKINIIDREL